MLRTPNCKVFFDLGHGYTVAFNFPLTNVYIKIDVAIVHGICLLDVYAVHNCEGII